MSGPSETHKITNVDFVFDRLKAQKQRHSNALVKGFPTPPSSCQTDTALLRSMFLPSVDTAPKRCAFPQTHIAHTLVVALTRVFVCPLVAIPRGIGQPQTYVPSLKF